jgi:hypothetical protein
VKFNLKNIEKIIYSRWAMYPFIVGIKLWIIVRVRNFSTHATHEKTEDNLKEKYIIMQNYGYSKSKL